MEWAVFVHNKIIFNNFTIPLFFVRIILTLWNNVLMSIELSKAQKFSSKGIILMKTANLYGYNKHIGIKN